MKEDTLNTITCLIASEHMEDGDIRTVMEALGRQDELKGCIIVSKESLEEIALFSFY